MDKHIENIIEIGQTKYEVLAAKLGGKIVHLSNDEDGPGNVPIIGGTGVGCSSVSETVNPIDSYFKHPDHILDILEDAADIILTQKQRKLAKNVAKKHLTDKTPTVRDLCNVWGMHKELAEFVTSVKHIFLYETKVHR